MPDQLTVNNLSGIFKLSQRDIQRRIPSFAGLNSASLRLVEEPASFEALDFVDNLHLGPADFVLDDVELVLPILVPVDVEGQNAAGPVLDVEHFHQDHLVVVLELEASLPHRFQKLVIVLGDALNFGALVELLNDLLLLVTQEFQHVDDLLAALCLIHRIHCLPYVVRVKLISVVLELPKRSLRGGLAELWGRAEALSHGVADLWIGGRTKAEH